MGHTLLCVLGLLLLNILLKCALAQDAVLSIEPNWSTFFTGESVTFICDMREGKDTDWHYEIYRDSTFLGYQDKNFTLQPLAEGHRGEYHCIGDHKYSPYGRKESNKVSLTVSAHRPKAHLRRGVPAGGKVTLTCSVSPSSSSGWKYFSYRGKNPSELLTTQDVVFLSDETISVSQGGLYRCRGGRGDPVYYTEYSDSVVTYRPVVTLHPNWPEIYFGETITLKCEIEDGGNNEWEYEWRRSNSQTAGKQKEYMIKHAVSSHSGDYRCLGKLKGETSSTEWSDAFKLKVSAKPRPVLTVSPLWLSPGASVTLNCSVKHPSAGWRFYWYKAVPELSSNVYNYESLPGSINGTEQDTYIVHGQTHTAGYVCRAGRGDPVYYTWYSEPKFVCSGDSHPAASLTVSPDSVQHFRTDSLSINCEGNSTQWKVRRLYTDGLLSHCSHWGTMTGSTCNIQSSQYLDEVFWCESEPELFSNAVNITKGYGNIILVSPARPVTEGQSVTLRCKSKTEKILSNVDFYKNDKLIENITTGELTFSAVSMSDEGFYKCTRKISRSRSDTSAKSWMSVKSSEPETSPPFPVLLIVGSVCGFVVLLVILLLLFLYRCRKSKDSSSIRPTSSQGPAPDNMIYQNETQHNECASALHGDATFYETVRAPEEPGNDESSDVTYSVVELKNIKKDVLNNEPEESTVYSDVKTASAADANLLYAQVHSKTKAKKNKGKSTPSAVDETLYSELKPGTTLDQ